MAGGMEAEFITGIINNYHITQSDIIVNNIKVSELIEIKKIYNTVKTQ